MIRKESNTLKYGSKHGFKSISLRAISNEGGFIISLANISLLSKPDESVCE